MAIITGKTIVECDDEDPRMGSCPREEFPADAERWQITAWLTARGWSLSGFEGHVRCPGCTRAHAAHEAARVEQRARDVAAYELVTRADRMAALAENPGAFGGHLDSNGDPAHGPGVLSSASDIAKRWLAGKVKIGDDLPLWQSALRASERRRGGCRVG